MSAGRSEAKPSAKSVEFFLVAQPTEPHGLSRRSSYVRRAAGSWSSLFWAKKLLFLRVGNFSANANYA